MKIESLFDLEIEMKNGEVIKLSVIEVKSKNSEADYYLIDGNNRQLAEFDTYETANYFIGYMRTYKSFCNAEDLGKIQQW